MVRKCDEVVEKLRLDKHRGKYFCLSRLYNNEPRSDLFIQKKSYEDDNYYFDENWKQMANLDQNKY